MKCPKCDDAYESGANFCPHCGVELGLPEKKLQGPSRLLAVVAVLVFIGLAGYFFKGMLFPFSANDPQNSTVAESATPVLLEDSNSTALEKQRGKEEEPVAPLASPAEPAAKEGVPLPASETQPGRLLPVGVVSVYDGWGNEISSISAVVVDNDWVALPTRACFGGVEWLFRFPPTGFSAPIDGGRWHLGEDVGLWHLAQSLDMESVPLQPWQPQGKTIWRSLLSQRQIDDVELVPDWRQGDWLHAANPLLPDESAVLLQNGRVTGWTFGGWLGGVYLWAGPAAEGREKAATVAEFYDKTFAGGREEQFVRALAMDGGPAERLQALLAGFLLDPKLDARDVPESLQPANMLGEARKLAEELYQQGKFDRLTGLLDEEVMRRIADFGLLKIAAEARIATGGFAESLDFIEKSGDDQGQPEDNAAVLDLRLQLYHLWVEDELAKGDLAAAADALARAKTFFADDPRLHLDGVELALAHGDWAAAEELLGQRVYPDSMAERVDTLARQISQLKMQEGAIVIPFAPGSHQIHVKATVNNRVTFPFLIDTGASVVSIPSALLPALGLKIDRNTPRYKVSTAGGIKDAWEITLSSIELEGWQVSNVRALVVDSDQQVDFGLLGLNFLDRFQMHLDSEEGVLILIPQ